MNCYRNIFGLILFIAPISIASASERIVGGRDVLEGEFPSYVALLDGDMDFQCGATAIAPDKLLTAAHCKVDSSWTAVVNVVDGEAALADTSRHVGVLSVHNHPDYDPGQNFVRSAEGMLNFLHSEDRSDLLEKTLHQLEEWDPIRNENWREALPELAEALA